MNEPRSNLEFSNAVADAKMAAGAMLANHGAEARALVAGMIGLPGLAAAIEGMSWAKSVGQSALQVAKTQADAALVEKATESMAAIGSGGTVAQKLDQNARAAALRESRAELTSTIYDKVFSTEEKVAFDKIDANAQYKIVELDKQGGLASKHEGAQAPTTISGAKLQESIVTAKALSQLHAPDSKLSQAEKDKAGENLTVLYTGKKTIETVTDAKNAVAGMQETFRTLKQVEVANAAPEVRAAIVVEYNKGAQALEKAKTNITADTSGKVPGKMADLVPSELGDMFGAAASVTLKTELKQQEAAKVTPAQGVQSSQAASSAHVSHEHLSRLIPNVDFKGGDTVKSPVVVQPRGRS